MTAFFPEAGARGSIRHFVYWLILAAIVAGTIEICAAATLWFVIVPRARFLVWIPDFDQAQAVFRAQGSPADTELVLPKDATAPPRDSTGAKFNSDFPELGHACA